MPWLPQTFLTVVRNLCNHPDKPMAAMAHGRRHAPLLLDADPDIQLHHLFDPNQDRLMVRYIDHFRMKKRRLGAAYEDFLHRRLVPGGTILARGTGRAAPCFPNWRGRGRFLGTRPDKHPRDMGAMARYHSAIKALPERHPLPKPLPLDRLAGFQAAAPGRYKVELRDA